MNRLNIAAWALVLASPVLASDPCPEPLCPDEGFGANGRVAIDFAYNDADRGNAIVRVPGEDRLYVIGQVSTTIAGDDDFGIACLLDDGSRCPDFGFEGTSIVAMDFTTNGLDAAIAGAVLPWGVAHDWRLVVVGQVERDLAGDTDFGVALLRPDGSLETDASGGIGAYFFDTPGTDFTDLPAAVAVTADGKILVGGTVDIAAGDSDWGFTRLNDNLTIDSSFGTDGRALLNVEGLAIMHGMILEPDGKIVAVGSRDFGDDQMVIARLNADGTPDTFFGFLGQTVFDFDLGGANSDAAWGVARDHSGRLIMIGQADASDGTCWTAAAVLPDGQPDSSFSIYGAAFASCSGGSIMAGRGILPLFDGSYLAVAESPDFGTHDFTVIEWWEDDSTFHSFSRAFPFDLGGTNDDRPRSMLIQPDGKIVVAGRVVGPNETLDFGVLRVLTRQIFADGFEAWGSAAEWDLVVTTP